MVRERVLVLAVAAALLGVANCQQDINPKCGDCDRTKCPELDECPGAKFMDLCNCCPVCERSLGQRCDIDPTQVTYGPCGDKMKCKRRLDIGNSKEATCECMFQTEVCGSDGLTYDTVCHVLEEAKLQQNLTVSRQGPCLRKPVIKTPPVSSTRRLGGILVLDCEASGVPVPTLSWELYRDNGQSIKLPNDDSGIAVQMRGGPEAHMVTTWVQIMKITKDNVGTYVCKASNSEGEAVETATITYE